MRASGQVEKVGPAGSPSGEEKPGTGITPGVKVVWGWPVPSNTAISVITMHNMTKTISASRNARNAIIAASYTEAAPNETLTHAHYAEDGEDCASGKRGAHGIAKIRSQHS